jgi:hypothetical protein
MDCLQGEDPGLAASGRSFDPSRRPWVHSSAIDASDPRALKLGRRDPKVHTREPIASRRATQGSMSGPRSHDSRGSRPPCPASRLRACDIETTISMNPNHQARTPRFGGGHRVDHDVNHWSRSHGPNPRRGDHAEGQEARHTLRWVATQSFHAGGPSLVIRACSFQGQFLALPRPRPTSSHLFFRNDPGSRVIK